MCFPLVCITKLQIDISSKLEVPYKILLQVQEQRILIILFDWLYVCDNHFI